MQVVMTSLRRTSKDAGQDVGLSGDPPNLAKVPGGFLDSVLSFIAAPLSLPSASQANDIDIGINPAWSNPSCSSDDRPFDFSGESSSRYDQLGIQSEETWLTIDDVKLLTQPSPAPAPSRKPPPSPSLKAACLDEDGSKKSEIKVPASAFASSSSSSTSAVKTPTQQSEIHNDSTFAFASPTSLPSSIKTSTIEIDTPQISTSDDAHAHAHATAFSTLSVETPATEMKRRETPPWDLQFSTPAPLTPSPTTGSNGTPFASAKNSENSTTVPTTEDWTSVLAAALNKPTSPTTSNSVPDNTSTRASPEGPKNAAAAKKQNPPQHHPHAQTIQQEQLDFGSAARAAREAEIKRWAAGKDGNVRALLSSLHLILWPECGWKSVALTELISPAAVKKVYRAALLHVHPDKIQRVGATAEQKYIAEGVFNLLNEAFKKFDTQELH